MSAYAVAVDAYYVGSGDGEAVMAEAVVIRDGDDVAATGKGVSAPTAANGNYEAPYYSMGATASAQPAPTPSPYAAPGPAAYSSPAPATYSSPTPSASRSVGEPVPHASTAHLLTQPPNRQPLEPTAEMLPDPRGITMTIQLFENERYSPRLGFSVRGLLPVDRGIFSNDDGTMSFSTLEEAAEQLLSKGWSFVDDWYITSAGNTAAPLPYRQVASGKGVSEDFGWMYSSDFGSFASSTGVARKSMGHFVRRREVTRVATFNETTLGNNPRQSCESCDHRSVEDLAGLLIEKIWLALRGRYKADFVRPHKVAKMKSALLDALFSVPQNAFSLPFVADQVGEFVKGQLKHGNRPETVPAFQPKSPDGRALVKLFPRDERRGIARALIRKLDLSYRFHCVDPQCGTGCVFATHRCPNPGCTVTFSRKDWHEHDATCEYKEVPCVLQCGTMVSRVGMNMHISQQCVMRQVPCPYDRCGCRPSGLIFRDVEAHCNVNNEYHLNLSSAYLAQTSAELQNLGSQVQSLRMQVTQAESRSHGRTF